MRKTIAVLGVFLALTVLTGCGNGNVPVKITNDLGAWNIEEVYIDPSDQAWGENLTSDVLEPGDSATFNVPADTYDIRVVDEDGDSYTLWGIEVGAEGYDWEVSLADID